jgi:hypothetical protein
VRSDEFSARRSDSLVAWPPGRLAAWPPGRLVAWSPGVAWPPGRRRVSRGLHRSRGRSQSSPGIPSSRRYDRPPTPGAANQGPMAAEEVTGPVRQCFYRTEKTPCGSKTPRRRCTSAVLPR